MKPVVTCSGQCGICMNFQSPPNVIINQQYSIHRDFYVRNEEPGRPLTRLEDTEL